jgi:mannosyltransferase
MVATCAGVVVTRGGPQYPGALGILMHHKNMFNIQAGLLPGGRVIKEGSRLLKHDYSRKTTLPLLYERWDLLALLAIILLGAALRFYGLGFQSLWSDELASWDFSEHDTVGRVIQGETQPPLYFLILHLWQWIFGDSEWALRLPSALAGWLCIPAIYLLGKRLYSGREGLMAALFIAVLWAPIYYSQEARPYSMLILLSILTSYFWWDVMMGLRYRGELPRREAALYVVCAVLCTYLHYFGLLLVVLQGAALAALARGTLRKDLLLYVPVVLAYSPWLPGMISQFQRAGAGTGEPSLEALLYYFEFLFGRSWLLALAAWTLLAFLLLRGWDDLRPRRKGGGVPPGLLLAAWVLVPFAVAYVVSRSFSEVLIARNLLISLPAVYLLVARSVTRAFSGKAAAVFQGTVAVGLAAACLAYLLYSADYYTTPTKEQVREAASYVVGHQDEATLVIRCDADDRLDYYLRSDETGGTNDVEACTARDFSKVEKKVKEGDYREVFHFISFNEADQQMISMLQRTFQPVHYERFDGASVVVYKVRKTAPDLPHPKPPSSLPKNE